MTYGLQLGLDYCLPSNGAAADHVSTKVQLPGTSGFFATAADQLTVTAAQQARQQQ